MPFCARGILLVLAVGCGSPKKPPPANAYALNPAAAPEARRAQPPAPEATSADASKPSATKAREAKVEAPKAPAPRGEVPPPPKGGTATPEPRVATTEAESSPDKGIYFDDDFARGSHCDRGNGQGGFGWGEMQSGRTDSVLPVRDPSSPSGCALAFIFQGNGDPADDAWAEQRFRLGKPGGEPLREIFVGFVLATPGNYRHRKPKGPDNNKLLRLWDRVYNKSTVHVGMSATGRNNPPGSSQVIVEYSTPKGTGNYNTGPWYPVMRPGGVDTVGYYVRTSSNIGMEDGVIRVWWNRKLVYERTNLPLAKPQALAGAFNGFGNGYLLGWANSGFTERTELHVWRFLMAPEPVAWFLPPQR